MKRIALFTAILLLIMSLSSCGGGYKREEGDSDLTVEIMNSLKPEERYCTEYEFEKYVLNSLFEGKIEYHESVMPLEKEDGSIDPIALLYKAEKILSVQNAALTRTYEEGKDYILEDGKLVIPSGSSIETLDYDYYYPENPIENHTFPCSNGRQIRLFYAPDAHNRQYVVTYIHGDEYDGPVPANKGDKLSKFWKKLKSGEEVTIVWYGDSITVGGDTSGMYNVAPNLPVYPKLVDEALRRLYPKAKINYVNTSVGGMTLPWGIENAEERVNAYTPDLVILAWGMNTAGQNVTQYKSSMKILLKKIQPKNPNCEFVIVAPMLPNYEAPNFVGDQVNYRNAIAQLETDGIVMANMTEIHEHLLTKKRFCDMTGNNINHCNDYLTRWYAQTVLETILEP
ncbi:MAG: SGNH/GDSL hydrolase family protein [Clostridia bacterium]|nr:SGNH/GDSL hydrolase family protein [Clostridia bacterium]